MKTQTRFLLIMWFCIIFLQNTVFAKDIVEKTVTKTFVANSSNTLDVDNKYGNVNISNWDRSEITFDIKIEISDSDLLDKINIEFAESGKTVSAKTVFSSNFNCRNCNMKIIYNISVPKGISYNLNNKYGNIKTDDVEGVAKISLQYGNLDAGNFSQTGNSLSIRYGTFKTGNFTGKIEAKYSTGSSMKNLGNSQIDLKYSKIKIETADELTVESAYTSVAIGTIKKLKADSRYDHYSIDRIDEMTGDMKYTDTKIALYKSCRCVTKYGKFNVYVAPEFSSIELDGAYTGFNLKFDSKAAYSLDFYGQRTNIKTPDNIDFQKKIVERHSHEIKATVGSPAKSSVKIKATYSRITME